MMLQIPVPPTPPTPQFDPNLIFMEGGPPLVLMIVLAALTATVIILWPIMRAFGRRLEGRGSADPAVKGEIDHLHARLGEVDALRQEVAELPRAGRFRRAPSHEGAMIATYWAEERAPDDIAANARLPAIGPR